MDEEQGPRPIRVVLAAPFPEIVGLHEKVAEFADRLDVCGAVMDAGGAIDQVRILEPDVVVLSDHLDGVAGVAGRLAATQPGTPIVVMRHDDGPELPAVGDTVAATATGTELHDAISRAVAAGQATPPALAAEPGGPRDDPVGHEMPTWFWQSQAAAGPASALAPATADGAAPAADDEAEEESIPPREERPSWPPPWFRLAAEEEARRDAETAARETAAREQAEREAAAEAERAAAEREAADRREAARAEAERTAAAREQEERDQAERETAARAASLSDRLEPAAAHYERVELPPVPEPAVFDAGSPAVDVAAMAAAPAPVETAATAEVPAPAPGPRPPAPAPLRRRTSGRAETVLVFSGKGGVGCSVVATNLAVALARRGSSVAIVDLNLQYGDVAVMLHLEGHANTIESLAQQGDQLDRDFLEEVLATGPEGVRALLAPASPEFADLVTAASLRAIFRELGRTFDYVIIDSAAHLEELVLEVMEIADRILVVTAYAIASVKDTKVTLKLLQSLGIEHDRISVVLNQTKQKVGFPVADIEKSLNFGILAQLPFEPRIDDTIDTGAPMTMTQPRSDFSKRIAEIADSLSPPEPTATTADAKRRFGFRR